VLQNYLSRDKLVAMLDNSDLEVYYADCTQPDGAGRIEMMRHGIHAAPLSAALQLADGQITFTRLNLASIDTLAGNLAVLLGKAQQGGARQPATRRESEPEESEKP
jgi:hypothetical protein